MRGTIWLECKGTIKQLINNCQTDIILSSSIISDYKDLQARETCQLIALVYGPNKIPADHATIMMRELYKTSKAIFIKRYPNRFPHGNGGGELPNFFVK